MKKKDFFWNLLTFAVVATLSIGMVSCSKDDDEVSVSMPSVSFGEKGGSQIIQVQSNANWIVSGAPSWLTVVPQQGSNNGSFTLNASENTERDSRSCTIYLTAGDASAIVSVFQSGKSKLPAADELVGSYTGTLKPMGYSDEPARCYITFSKLSNDAVRMEKLICEEFDLDMNPVNLTVKEESDGRITISSETSKSVEGSYYQGLLTLSFSNYLATFYFSGTKN